VWALIATLLLGQTEDDPGLGQVLNNLDEPFPEIVDDPGIGAPVAAPRDQEPQGIKVRLGYRTFTLVEGTRDGDAVQRFHVASLDVYPITWYIRVGLTTQAAFETDSPNHDWLVTQGLMIGLQLPGAFAPYVDAGAQVGLGKRNFYVPQIDH
jgi:hypothetical protein